MGPGVCSWVTEHLPSPQQPPHTGTWHPIPPTHTCTSPPTSTHMHITPHIHTHAQAHKETHTHVHCSPAAPTLAPPASLPSPSPLSPLPFAYSLFWACWHRKLELHVPKKHRGAKQAWGWGVQPNLDPKSQPDLSVTGFPGNE